MAKVQNLGHEAWVRYTPPHARDVRKIFSRFWTLTAAIEERQKRIHILENSRSDASHVLALLLSATSRRKAATVGCCPVLARRFQIFFVSQALRVANKQPDEGIRYTFLDKHDAVPFGQLHRVNWRKIHHRFRRRLERRLGKGIVVYGVGEVEADYSRGVWQPHYHVTIHGASKRALGELRKAHYRAKRTGTRPMVRSKPQYLEGWLAYASKLVAFAKTPQTDGPSRRCRLRPELSLEHFRYLARRRPTSFVFSLNCRIVKSSA